MKRKTITIITVVDDVEVTFVLVRLVACGGPQ